MGPFYILQYIQIVSQQMQILLKLKYFFFVKKTIQTKTKKNLFKIWPMNIAMDLNPLPISFNS